MTVKTEAVRFSEKQITLTKQHGITVHLCWTSAQLMFRKNPSSCISKQRNKTCDFVWTGQGWWTTAAASGKWKCHWRLYLQTEATLVRRQQACWVAVFIKTTEVAKKVKTSLVNKTASRRHPFTLRKTVSRPPCAFDCLTALWVTGTMGQRLLW